MNDKIDIVSFHDSKVYGIAFLESNNEFLLDIDYISDWIKKENSEKYELISFPATLVFENVWDIEININTDISLNIDQIQRFNPHPPRNIKYLPCDSIEYEWEISFMEGEIKFRSIGLILYNRLDYSNIKTQDSILKEDRQICFKKEGSIFFKS